MYNTRVPTSIASGFVITLSSAAMALSEASHWTLGTNISVSASIFATTSSSLTRQHPENKPKFLTFQILQRTVEALILTIPNFLLQSQHLAMDSISLSISKPSAREISSQAFLATTHPKNKWLTDSFSTHNRRACLLFPKLSLVTNLFLDNNQRKKCTLGGRTSFQTEGIKAGGAPPKLIKDCVE
jgi:hypothetical protein